ncbi:hypothetical protein Tco_0908547 [Tanacetum coccineum]|uniref:Uncharacterized protein n=1 Tax=Tanacetum coccineum TaxID=301880 RepID=A0ABQ5CPE5_9ASTR
MFKDSSCFKNFYFFLNIHSLPSKWDVKGGGSKMKEVGIHLGQEVTVSSNRKGMDLILALDPLVLSDYPNSKITRNENRPGYSPSFSGKLLRMNREPIKAIHWCS